MFAGDVEGLTEHQIPDWLRGTIPKVLQRISRKLNTFNCSAIEMLALTKAKPTVRCLQTHFSSLDSIRRDSLPQIPGIPPDFLLCITSMPLSCSYHWKLVGFGYCQIATMKWFNLEVTFQELWRAKGFGWVSVPWQLMTTDCLWLLPCLAMFLVCTFLTS